METTKRGKWHTVLIYAALTIATAVAYEPIRHNDFVNYDDLDYLIQNEEVRQGLTVESVKWAFTSGHASNWHPLTWLSHMLDVELFGMDPLGHHLVSVFLHLINALLVFAIFKRMTGNIWCSAFVAAVFALHPLRVESVAWAAERKDVLSALFWLLTMAAYLHYTRRPGVARYLPVFLFLGLGLMAKPMLVTLPFVLLLLDYWPLRRLRWQRQEQLENHELPQASQPNHSRIPLSHLLTEKAPLLVLVAASCIVTYFIQQSTGAMDVKWTLPLYVRTMNAFMSYVGYIAKMIYPSELTAFYPHPFSESVHLLRPIIMFLILAAISVWVVCAGRRRPYIKMGWLWYLGTLVPVIGIVQVGNQGMADRYMYLPAIGISIIVAWGATDLLANWSARRLLQLAAAAVLVALTVGTRIQVGYWRDSGALYEHGLAVTKENFVMHNNYGDFLRRNGRAAEAIPHLQESIRIRDNYPIAHRNLANALLADNRLPEAVKQFDKVIEMRPDWADAYANRGVAYARNGNFEQAIESYQQALAIDPDDPTPRNNLAKLRRLLQQKEAASPNQP